MSPGGPGADEPEVVVAQDTTSLVEQVVERLLAAVSGALDERGRADVVLTGGRVAGRVLQAVADAPATASLDWGRVHLWWGDERFVPSGDEERNETLAASTLLGAPALAAAHVHPMPASDGPDGADAVAAAARYTAELAEQADGASVPRFDVLMLGVGPDGHVASLFPGRPSLGVTDEPVVVETESPKPPPVRLSLTLPAITAAREVWLVVSGADKADAVARALAAADVASTPAVAARGTSATRWLLDREAAGRH